MSVSAIPGIITYNGNESTVDPYPIPFKFRSNDHVKIYVDGVLAAFGYTVTGAGLPEGDPAAEVVLSVAIPSTSKVAIVRETPNTQGTEFEEGDSLSASVLEAALDNAILQIQEQKDKLDRIPTSAPGVTPPGGNLEQNPNTTLGQDGSGNWISRTAEQEVEHLGIAAEVAAAAASATAAQGFAETSEIQSGLANDERVLAEAAAADAINATGDAAGALIALGDSFLYLPRLEITGDTDAANASGMNFPLDGGRVINIRKDTLGGFSPNDTFIFQGTQPNTTIAYFVGRWLNGLSMDPAFVIAAPTTPAGAGYFAQDLNTNVVPFGNYSIPVETLGTPTNAQWQDGEPTAQIGISNPMPFLLSVAQTLTQDELDQVKANLPGVANDYVRPAKFVICGDSMSKGTTGQWSTQIQADPMFANTTFINVAASAAKTFEQDGAYWDTNVLPHAPTGDEVAYMSSLIGINDIFQVGGSAGTVSDIYERIKGIWKKGRDAGFRVIAFTLQDHSFPSAGILEPEQRKSQLNRLILSDPTLYDYLVPLHELIPDENTYAFNPPTDLLHLNAAGNQLIADFIVKIIGPYQRTDNNQVKEIVDAQLETRMTEFSLFQRDFNYPEFNLALATEVTASGGTVTNHHGYKRLETTTTNGSQAAMLFEWPFMDGGNTIAWATLRNRGLFVDIDPVLLSTEQVLSIFIGTNSVVKDLHYVGFEVRRNSSNIEIRIIELTEGGVASESAWTSIGNLNDVKFILNHFDQDITLLCQGSNGTNITRLWNEFTHTGGPNSFEANSAYVVARLDSLGSPSSGTGIVTIRQIAPFDTEQRTLQRIKY